MPTWKKLLIAWVIVSAVLIVWNALPGGPKQAASDLSEIQARAAARAQQGQAEQGRR